MNVLVEGSDLTTTPETNLTFRPMMAPCRSTEERLALCESTLTSVRDALGWDVDPRLAGCTCDYSAPNPDPACPAHREDPR